MRPTQPLFKRLKTRLAFTTKQVGKGFYRGSNVGSLGAHTRYGNYMIDWRKTRHYVVPDLKDCKLTPFVSGNIPVRERLPVDPSGNPYDRSNIDGMQYLKWWKAQNDSEYQWVLNQELQKEAEAQRQAELMAQEQGTAHQEQPTR
ncbi:60S ribosomal protein L27, mitochondrial [Exophiala xenobiotica]|uniref:60S ribosomal protein L27, mitochondrial n=1 Tax=Lithohypha guttulata TaxID=1690604 RepID=A0ABR0K8A1_9EURO|nr:60S ribosomal protein L27, mitochondrial [Lithohypha guttulata]KAK5324399.1 60S ribosomal protein L27, mitochondrial [Exophiala xenobiotica]